jgi:hypothetical protein
VTASALAISAEADLKALDDAEQQSSFCEPKYCGRRGSGFGSSVPVNLSHAKVAREPAKPKAAPPIPAPIAPPTVEKPPSRTSVGRLIATYDEVIDIFRARADELELSRLEIDRLTGLADAHTSHLLARKFTQVFGPVSLPLMLDVLGLRLLVVEDPELTARTLKRRTPRIASHARCPRQLSVPIAPDPKP